MQVAQSNFLSKILPGQFDYTFAFLLNREGNLTDKLVLLHLDEQLYEALPSVIF